jgi:hypothetical protein
MGRSCIVVLGMHRSGTSAMTGLLSAFGPVLGEDLLPANEANPKGFFESRRLVELNNRILESVGSAWDALEPLPQRWWELPAAAALKADLADFLQGQGGATAPLLLKDPRLSKTLPLWKEVFAAAGVAAKYVVCLREPGAVAVSQRAMKGFSYLKCLMLYIDYSLHAEWHTRGETRWTVAYEDLVQDWHTQLEQLDAALSLGFAASRASWDTQAADFVTPELNRSSHAGQSDLAACGALWQMALSSYQTLAAADCDEADRQREGFAVYCHHVRPWVGMLQDLVRIEAQYPFAALLHRQSVPRIQSTLSWCHPGHDGAESPASSKCTWPHVPGRHTLSLALPEHGRSGHLRLRLINHPGLVRVFGCSLRSASNAIQHVWKLGSGELSGVSKGAHEVPFLAGEGSSAWLLLDHASYLDVALPDTPELSATLVVEMEVEDPRVGGKQVMAQLARLRKEQDRLKGDIKRAAAAAFIDLPAGSAAQSLPQVLEAFQRREQAFHARNEQLGQDIKRGEAQLGLLKELLLAGQSDSL